MENSNLAYQYEETQEEERAYPIEKLPQDSTVPQKLFGLFLVAAGIILPILCDGDATGSLLLMPLGVVLLIKKSKVM